MILKNLVCFLWPGLINFEVLPYSGLLFWGLEENLEFNDSSEYFLLPDKDFNLFFFSIFSTDSETESPNKDSDDSSDFSSSLENFRSRAGLISFLLS